ANANTSGYSRQIVNQERRTFAGAGAGVQLGPITRQVDQGLLTELRLESGRQQASAAKSGILSRVQDLFGTPENDGSLAHLLADLQGAVESLAMAPQGALEQRAMVRAAQDVALSLRQSSATLQSLRREADAQISAGVREINGLLQSVSELNDTIVRNGATGQSVTDLEDNRETKLDRLAQLIDIRVVDRGRNGDIVVFTAAGRTLLDGDPVTFHHATASNLDASVDHASGMIDGITIGDPDTGNDVTLELRSGELAGLIESRDRTLPELQTALDELAARLRDDANAVHNRGVGPGLATMSGSRSFDDPATAAITFGGTTDTALVLLDAAGNEVAQTTVRTLLDDPGATGDPASTGDATATVAELRTALDGALAGRVTARLVDGRLELSAAPGLTLALRDQSASTRGAAPEDATIGFDADGDGGIDQTARGFSAFFGLNDLFVDHQGPQVARTGVAANIDVRADIAADPSRVARGALQWDGGRLPAGRYTLAPGDDTVIQQLATTLAAGSSLAAAGRLPATSMTLTAYATTLISDASVQAADTEEDARFRSELVASLKQKSDSVRGVNIDEELSDLMLYEQAYSAAARVIKVVQEMFDTLERAMS
ncbi:MAG TPA: flagellar hook-associated protein FlgK, partial [Rhodospirillales bacterium]|nr:flagellar hook-associated protein FlgK [Rhodospirillales bacterium]